MHYLVYKISMAVIRSSPMTLYYIDILQVRIAIVQLQNIHHALLKFLLKLARLPLKLARPLLKLARRLLKLARLFLKLARLLLKLGRFVKKYRHMLN
jgi:hypothetical protein